jgi:membrane protease YdiL (CAAX protease family)
VIWGGVLLAFTCWGFTFGWSGGNFWVKIGLSALAVSVYSSFWEKPRIHPGIGPFFFGLVAASVLYLIFFLGHCLAPYFLSGAKSEVGRIYSMGEGTNRVSVFLLLFFITGPAEEIFWRGFLQDHLMKRWGNIQGFTVATLVYAAVHVFSRNPMLILAALLAGGFWGLLYLWKRDLWAQITSHSCWSAVIFALAPIQ